MEIVIFAPPPELTIKGMVIAFAGALLGAFAAGHFLIERGQGIMLFFGKRVHLGDPYGLLLVALVANAIYSSAIGYFVIAASDLRQYMLVSLYTTAIFAGYRLLSGGGIAERGRRGSRVPVDKRQRAG